MATEIKEMVVRIPRNILEKSCGFSLDIGGSTAKVAYRSRQEYSGGRRLGDEDDELGRLHLALFERDDVTNLIAYIRDNCDMTSEEDGVRRIHSTGFGGNNFRPRIEAELDVKLVNHMELPCHSRGINTLKRHLPREEVFTPHPEAAMTKARKMLEDWKVFDKVGVGSLAHHQETEDQLTGKCPGNPEFPVMLVIGGSAFVYVKMEESGQVDVLEVSLLGGRFHAAIVALLTGLKSYDTLIEMVRDFDGKTVDLYTTDMLTSTTEDAYSVLTQKDLLLFPMGKGDTKPRNEIRDGDVIHSLTEIFTENVVTIAFHAARGSGIKKIYLCGNFFRHECIRESATRGIYVKNARSGEDQRVEHEYPRDGGLLAVIGAFTYSALPED